MNEIHCPNTCRCKKFESYRMVTHHICNLIFFPLNSTVLILKSIPKRNNAKFSGIGMTRIPLYEFNGFGFGVEDDNLLIKFGNLSNELESIKPSKLTKLILTYSRNECR